MNKRKYPLSMNFAMNQPRSVNNNNMFVRWDMKPYVL